MFVQGDVRAQSAPVVRRCSKCEQAAVVLVHDWKHTVGSTATGWSTKDYRCQTLRREVPHPPADAGRGVDARWIRE